MKVSSVLQLPLQLAYNRKVLLAVELLDAVTLERVSQNIKVEAKGLRGKPIVNASGIFVWLQEDFTALDRIVINPGERPYEPVELLASQVKRPLTTVELLPRIDYPFMTGVTGLRGNLIESEVFSNRAPEPVHDATVYLEWLDVENTWKDSSIVVRTNPANGVFLPFLRLAPEQHPLVDAEASFTLRLHVARPGYLDRRSKEFKLRQGQITNPTTDKPLTFAWADLLISV